jgi:hypothetical protein
MPIFRYFIFVGGALLALLFAVNLALPNTPEGETILTSGGDLPLIRIHSDHKLPERVVLDTSQPTIVPPAVQVATVAAPSPPTHTAASPALAEMSAKARVRETFAQFVPPKADAATINNKKAQVRPLPQPKRRVARNSRPYYPAPGKPMMLVAQQPHFGLFNMTW